MWRTYTINGKTYYAPTLLLAFHQARCNGEGSNTLACTGSVPGRPQ